MNNQTPISDRFAASMPETTTAVVISTMHMPESEPDFGPVRAMSDEYCVVVFLYPSLQLSDCPEWLADVVTFARRQKASIVIFDRDAGVDSTLPTFDW